MKFKYIFFLLLGLHFSGLYAQQAFSSVLHGRVSSENQPVPFASISVKGTAYGTETDRNGQFRLEVPPGEYRVEVSALGYKTFVRKIVLSRDESVQFPVNLEAAALELEDVILVDHQSGLTRKTPYSVSAINMKDISRMGTPGGIAGTLKEIPGVSGAELGPGIVKPFIRGLGFSRVVTIYQNNKLENQQWGEDHGLGLNDLGVTSVDVIKGPASILYGSGALGGVVLIKDDEDYLQDTRLRLQAGSTYNSISNGIRTYTSAGKSFDNGLFVAADAAYENHADYKDGNGRIIGNSRFNNHTFRVHTGLQKENFRNKLSFTYHSQDLGIIEDDEMDDEASLATTRNDRKMQLPFQKIRDMLISYTQESFHDNLNTYFHLSHHRNDRKEIEEAFDETDLGLKQSNTFYSARVSLNPDSDFVHSFGLQGGFVNNRNMENAQDILIPDAWIIDSGIYYLGSLTLNDYFIQGGLRYDYRETRADASSPALVDYGFILPGDPDNRKLNRYFSGLTSSLGVSRRFGEKHQVKLNFSTGFRAPDLAELFSNGPHPGTNRFESGNADFKREQSLQADLNYSYASRSLRINAAVFASRVDNYIYFANTGTTRPEDGLEIWAYQQNDARLYGTEWELTYIPMTSGLIELSAKGALVRGEQRGNEENLTFIPADNYTFEANAFPTPGKSTRLFAALRYVSTQDRPGFNEERTPMYTLLNGGVSHEFSLGNNTLSAGLTVHNALNRTYMDHLSVLRTFGVTNPGRNIMLNLSYRL